MPGLDEQLEALLNGEPVGIPHNPDSIFVRHNDGMVYEVPPTGSSVIVRHIPRNSTTLWAVGGTFQNGGFARNVRANPTNGSWWVQVYPCDCPRHQGVATFHATQ